MANEAIELQRSETGWRLRLRVKPGGRRDRIVGPLGGALKLEVKAPPERGKANVAVLRLLAEVLGLPRSAIELRLGETSKDKMVELQGVDGPELCRRLAGIGVAAELR